MTFHNINETQLSLLKKLLEEGEEVEARGLKTLELAPIMFSISDPIDRLTTLKNRNWSFASAIGELVWHLSGSNDVSFITRYLKKWGDYSDDGKCIKGSSYGHKIFKKNANDKSQWDCLVELIRKDRGTRRAVLDLYDGTNELSFNLVDVPCTCSLQFLVRNQKVNLIVYMRSNDIIWGLPYDFFFFSFLQELLAASLELEIGVYTHFAASLHLYEHHFSLAKKIIGSDSYASHRMKRLDGVQNLKKFISIEKKIRDGNFTFEELNKSGLEDYWIDLLKVLFYYYAKNSGPRKKLAII